MYSVVSDTNIRTAFRWTVNSFAPVTTSHINLHTLVSYLKRQHHRICQLFEIPKAGA
jgi:hypothetical protein